MENLMDEIKDDNLDQRWKNWKKEKQNKNENPRVGSGFWFKESKGKCEQMRKEESGACMQPHVREGMVFFDNLT